jgi:hypothetical protein
MTSNPKYMAVVEAVVGRNRPEDVRAIPRLPGFTALAVVVDRALLKAEALALFGRPHGRKPGIPENCHDTLCLLVCLRQMEAASSGR